MSLSSLPSVTDNNWASDSGPMTIQNPDEMDRRVGELGRELTIQEGGSTPLEGRIERDPEVFYPVELLPDLWISIFSMLGETPLDRQMISKSLLGLAISADCIAARTLAGSRTACRYLVNHCLGNIQWVRHVLSKATSKVKQYFYLRERVCAKPL